MSQVKPAGGETITIEQLRQKDPDYTDTFEFTQESYRYKGPNDESMRGNYTIKGGNELTLVIGKDADAKARVDGTQFSFTLMDTTWTYV
ncbi:MAG: hypothetical protein ACOX8I_08925, partial [Bacillota bacterium]